MTAPEDRYTEPRTFIGWLGSGYNSRGAFPATLSELSADLREWAAVAASDAPLPALGELARLATADVAELNSAAQEYEDSADACDTPALAGFRRRRYARAKALRAAAERIAQLVALATGGAEMREALRRVGIGTSDECGDTGAMVEWFATTEQGEQGCGTLDAALAMLTDAAKEDGRREAGADTARIDWLEQRAKQDESVTLGWSRKDHDYDEWAGRSVVWPESFWVGDETAIDPPHPTLRPAIDAARSLTPERPADAD
jgi:hypothetical protein